MITIDTWEKKTPERQKSTKFLKRVKPKCFEKQKESQCGWHRIGDDITEVREKGPDGVHFFKSWERVWTI